MDICFIRHSVLKRGGDKMVLAHAGYLAEKGHDVTIIANKIDTVFPISPKIKIVLMPLKGKLGTLIFCLFKKQSKSLLIADIIVLASILFLRNGNRVVYFAQDCDETYYRSISLKLLIHSIYYCGLKLMKIPTIAVSERLASQFSKRFTAAVTIVANGIDMDTFYAKPSPALLQDKEGRKAILLLSRKDRRKGFDLARIVVAKISQLHTKPLEVWTIGEPATGMFPGLRHRDFGYADEKTLRTIYSSADVFLYPSRHEGFALMVLEAFACRCPVVTTEAVPYVKNDINALVCRIEDSNSLANRVRVFLESAEIRNKIVDQAFLYATLNTIQKSHYLFEETLLNIYSTQVDIREARLKSLH